MYVFQINTDNLPYEKVGKNEPVCIADEVPFDIPDSWEWVRLSTANDMYTGNSINENEKKLISRHEITATLEDFIKI